MNNNIPIINVCGKRTMEYVCTCLAQFNRGINTLTLRTIGRNISKGVEIAQIFQKELNTQTDNIEIGSFLDGLMDLSWMELTLKKQEDLSTTSNNINYQLPQSGYVDYPVYHLLLDWYLHNTEKLTLYSQTNNPLITIFNQNGSIKCQKNVPGDEKILNDINRAFYRCGFFLPSNWKNIAIRLSEFDDVILGVDTNVIYNCTISECLLPAISLIKPKEYVYTPNWILFIIPNAVMHELEEASNIRNPKGSLKPQGRMGFRALQEIIELSQSKDIAGISLLIVGKANPFLDIRIELQGLRRDIYERDRNIAIARGEKLPPFRLAKSSSGDTVIRDQFKGFLRQIDFHKGVYFLTADKSNAALSRTEGLPSICIRSPLEYQGDEVQEYDVKIGENEIKIEVPIGKLIYEMAVQFGTIKIKWDDKEIEIQCDRRGENLNYWIQRKLRMEETDLNELLKDYHGKLEWDIVMNIWKKITNNFESEEVCNF